MLSSVVARRVRFMVYLLRHNTRCVNPWLAQRTLLLQERSAVRLGGAAHSSCSPPVHCVVVESVAAVANGGNHHTLRHRGMQ